MKLRFIPSPYGTFSDGEKIKNSEEAPNPALELLSLNSPVGKAVVKYIDAEGCAIRLAALIKKTKRLK